MPRFFKKDYLKVKGKNANFKEILTLKQDKMLGHSDFYKHRFAKRRDKTFDILKEYSYTGSI